MNTIEPDFLRETRELITHFYNEGSINSTLLIDLERERNNWFISVLERDSISYEEEKKIQIWKELDIFGYTYIGKIRVNKLLFKFLYKLKLIKI